MTCINPRHFSVRLSAIKFLAEPFYILGLKLENKQNIIKLKQLHMKKTFFTIQVMTLLLTACQNTSTSPTAEPIALERASEATESPNGDAENGGIPDERMDAYVRLLNGFASRASESYERYLSWCDEQKGPTGKERNNYGLYKIDYKDDLEAAKKLIPASPIQPIDQYAKAFIEASLPLVNLVSEAEYYYDQENFKDDNMAKGKELHPKLIAAFKAYFDTKTAFKEEYNKLYEAAAAKQMEALRKQGKTLAIDMQSIVNKSEALLKELMPIATDLKAKPSAEQLASVKAKFDDLEALVLSFESGVKSTEESKLEEQFGSTNYLSWFVDHSKDFLKEGKEVFRKRKEGKGFDSSYENLVNSLGDKYDDIVKDMNNARILI